MEYEGARIKVERLAQRFGEPYKLLAYHAALPLMLTPELLNYLRNKFLGDKVPWVAEVDLLLSDLCKEVAYEQFAMEPDTRAYLLAEADKNLGRPHMQDVARLLIRYVQSLSGSASAAARHQLQAQRWAAMVYLDEQRESAVQEIAESFLRSMTPVASAAGHLGSLPIDESELARLSQITKILAPQLEASRELVEYAAEVSRILAARGADAQAAAAGSKPARVADVALPAPAVLLGETIPEEEEDEELEDYTEDDLFIGFSSEDQSFLNGYLLPRLVAAGLGCQLFQYRPGGKDVLDDLVSRVRRGGRALLLLNSHSVSEIRGLQGLLDDAPDYHELEDKFLLGFTQQMKLPHQLRKLRIYRFYGAPGQIEDELKLLLDTRFYDAFHDHLTRLPNRALFMDHLKLAIARARRNPGTKFAVLSLGLDRFKVINNAFGHTIGDQLLVRVADRLESCLRPGDTVARIGGDDFAMLLEDIETPEAEVEMAERVQKALTQPFQIGRHEVLVTVSIGVAPSSTGYERAEDILRDADTAMYRAKSLGKARYEIFDKAMHARAINLLQMETDMRRALEREEFVLHYQPIVALEDFQLRGFEALVRWQHPERGFISPMDFIPVAEETGMIVPLGEWVMREACRQMNGWQRLFPLQRPLFITVNLSSKQFSQATLISTFAMILQETGVKPHSVKLEITESVVMENIETATEMLRQLRGLGVKLAIDDFGTGYSSLSYLHRFPIDTLKIDRSFVTRMSENNENTEIVRTIVVLAQNLGMDVVAEGVETNEQLVLLQKLGCENGQGYFFSKPVNADGAEKIIAETYGALTRPKIG